MSDNVYFRVFTIVMVLVIFMTGFLLGYHLVERDSDGVVNCSFETVAIYDMDLNVTRFYRCDAFDEDNFLMSLVGDHRDLDSVPDFDVDSIVRADGVPLMVISSVGGVDVASACQTLRNNLNNPSLEDPFGLTFLAAWNCDNTLVLVESGLLSDREARYRLATYNIVLEKSVVGGGS